MGTRGAIGFRFKEQDKVTYNHWDSYPTGIGVDVFGLVRTYDDEQLAGAACRLVLVDEDKPPTAELIARYAPHTNTGVSTGSPEEWYVLLRDSQGTLVPYVDGTIDHMIDSHEFLTDSLFCEWAYIINLDDSTLEVYRGFNKGANGAGRYAAAKDERNDYYGVVLLNAFPLADVRALTEEGLTQLMSDLEELESAQSED